MARLPRLSLPGHVHHVIQHGHNRQPIFVDRQDFERMLALLEESASRFQVAVHAYVLMDNHFHLLLTPATAEALPLFMQAVGRSYVRYFNLRHGRTGTLWDGRYRATVIEVERYLLACMAYIDLNPVRAGLCTEAGDWPWSSHAHYMGRHHDRLVTPHARYWTLGNTPFAREAAYAEMVRAGVAAPVQAALTESTRKGWALGEAGFLANVQQQSPRRVVKGQAGRPAKVAAKSD